MVWDWKSAIKWCSGCIAPAKWKRLPYFCPGLVLSCRLRVDHLIYSPQPCTTMPCTAVWGPGCMWMLLEAIETTGDSSHSALDLCGKNSAFSLIEKLQQTTMCISILSQNWKSLTLKWLSEVIHHPSCICLWMEVIFCNHKFKNK